MAKFLSRILHRESKPAAKQLEKAERAAAENRYADAAKIYRKLAEMGDAGAQLRLAQAYERGQGVLQNFVESERWFRAAAEQGSVPAKARLGEIYLTGLEPSGTASPAAISRLDDGKRWDRTWQWR